MKRGKSSVRARLNFIRTALFVWTVLLLLLPSVAHAQQSTPTKRVLVLDWYDKDHPWNVTFDESFQAVLKSAPAEIVEYYPEYLQSNRFPGQNQSRLLRDYLQRKYADRTIDVVVANSDASLDFLLKYRDNLFPQTPIVFVATRHFSKEELAAGPGITGIINLGTYTQTLDLALRLHPGTEHAFVISGTLERDKRFETLARGQLQGYESRVQITYLTDLTLEELIAKTKSLPARSIVLHVWQQSQTEQGKILETAEMLDLIARSATVPIYGMAFQRVWTLHSEDSIEGSGIVGGYITPPETIGTRVAEMSLRILSGERAQEIPVESAPAVPMFDWRELRRWGISEKALPPGSIVRFRVPSIWDEYKWHIIVLISLIGVQAALIGGLLINRAKRKRANKELCESQERYGLATTAGRTGVWDWDLRTGEMYIDPLLKSLLGYEDHEIHNHIDDWSRLVHPEDVQESFQRVQAYRDGATPHLESEHRMLHKDGSVRWFLARGTVVRDNEGKEVRLVGTDTDITESKRADDALRQSEARTRAILTALPDLIFMLTRDGTYLDFYARDSGELFAPPESFIGRNMHEVLPLELARSFERCIAQTEKSSEPVILDYSLQMGRDERYYESSMVKLDVDRVMCIVRDITGRKRAEMRFRRYFELPLIGMAITSPDREFLEVNQELCDMLGYSSEELTGKSWVDVTHPDDVAENVRLLEQTLSGETEGYTMEKRFIHRDGHTVYTSISARCVRREDNTVDHLVLVLQGITERKRAEEALQQTQSELAHIARVMTTGELAATIAHEVNQPLTAVVANANAVRRMIGNGGRGFDEVREAIDDIVKDAHRASDVVDRIRSLLKKGPRLTEPTAINEVIEGVVGILRNDLVGKRVSLNLEMSTDLPAVEADRVEIQQVMLNLILNAIEAMTRIEDADRNLVIRTSHESGGVLIEVRDSGVGIAAENMERIFDAFYTTRTNGMGMGLPICRTIIEMHGGKLWAESNDDRGVTLRFTLPVTIGEAS